MRQSSSVYNARWKARHPDYKAPTYPEKAREQYLKNREKYLIRANERYKSMTPEQREEHNRKRRERHARNPEVRNRIERKRDHTKRAKGKFSIWTWEIVKMKYNNQCIYCGSKENITIEHRLPISLGGDNGFSNLAPACLSCNSSKRNMTEYAYREWRKKNNKVLAPILEVQYDVW